MKNLAIPGAIVLAGALIAGAVFWSSASPDGNSAAVITATDLNYDSADIESLINDLGVDGRLLGDPEASVRIAEYSDTECPFCKRFHGTMIQVMDKYGADGEVAWEYKYFPIAQLHRQAPKQAEALACIEELGGGESFWIGLDAIFSITQGNDSFDHDKLPAVAEKAGVDRDDFSECLESGRHEELVQSEVEEAQSKGASGTPFSVFQLSQPISAEARATIEQIDEEQAPGQTLFEFAEDGTEIRVSGAIPFQLLEPILDAILER